MFTELQNKVIEDFKATGRKIKIIKSPRTGKVTISINGHTPLPVDMAIDRMHQIIMAE